MKQIGYFLLLLTVAFLLWNYSESQKQMRDISQKLDILIENKNHQNALIVTSVKQSLEDQFQEGFECLIDNQ